MSMCPREPTLLFLSYYFLYSTFEQEISLTQLSFKNFIYIHLCACTFQFICMCNMCMQVQAEARRGHQLTLELELLVDVSVEN